MANTSPATPTYPDPLDWRGGEVVTTEKLATLLGLINHLMEQQGAAVAYSASYPDDVLFWDDDEPDDPQLSIIIPEISDLHTSLTIRVKLSEDGASGTKAVRFYSQGADADITANPVGGGAETWVELSLDTGALTNESYDIIDVYLSTTGDGVSVHAISIEVDPPSTLDGVFTTQSANVSSVNTLVDHVGWLLGSDANGADYPLTAGRAKAIIQTTGHLVQRPRLYQNWSAIRGLGAGLYRLPSIGVRSWPIDIFGEVRDGNALQAGLTIYETDGAAGEFALAVAGSLLALFDADIETVYRRGVRPPVGDPNYINAPAGLEPFLVQVRTFGPGPVPDPDLAKFSRICIWGQ